MGGLNRAEYLMGSALCRRPLTFRWEVVWWFGVAVWWCVGVVVAGGVAVVPFVALIVGVDGITATNRTSSGNEVVVLVWGWLVWWLCCIYDNLKYCKHTGDPCGSPVYWLPLEYKNIIF